MGFFQLDQKIRIIHDMVIINHVCPCLNQGSLSIDISNFSVLARFVVKFICSEKATNFCEISTLDLPYVVTFKSRVEISQNFVAFSEYMNFMYKFVRKPWTTVSVTIFLYFNSKERKRLPKKLTLVENHKNAIKSCQIVLFSSKNSISHHFVCL